MQRAARTIRRCGVTGAIAWHTAVENAGARMVADIRQGATEDGRRTRRKHSKVGQELERMIVDQGGMSFESFEGQLAATAQAIVSGGTSFGSNDAHADLLRRMEEDYGIVFPDDEFELGGANDAVYFEIPREP